MSTLKTGLTSLSHPIKGDVYFDEYTGHYQIFDGLCWREFVNTRIETEEEILLKRHPGLSKLKQELDEAKEKYEAYYALCKE